MQCKPDLFKDIEIFTQAPTNAAIVQIVIPPRATGGYWQNSDENRARRPKRVRFADESSGRMTKELLCVAVPVKKRSEGRAKVEISAVEIPKTKRPMGSWRHFGGYAVLEPRSNVPAVVPAVVLAVVSVVVPAVIPAVVPAMVPAAEETITDDEDVEPPPNDEAPINFGDSPDKEAALEPPPNDEVSTPSENGANEEPVLKRRKGGRRPKKRPRQPIITTGRSCAQVLKEAEEEGRRNGPPPIDPTWRIVPDPVAATTQRPNAPKIAPRRPN
jgi:hypothetical protein